MYTIWLCDSWDVFKPRPLFQEKSEKKSRPWQKYISQNSFDDLLLKGTAQKFRKSAYSLNCHFDLCVHLYFRKCPTISLINMFVIHVFITDL